MFERAVQIWRALVMGIVAWHLIC